MKFSDVTSLLVKTASAHFWPTVAISAVGAGGVAYAAYKATAVSPEIRARARASGMSIDQYRAAVGRAAGAAGASAVLGTQNLLESARRAGMTPAQYSAAYRQMHAHPFEASTTPVSPAIPKTSALVHIPNPNWLPPGSELNLKDLTSSDRLEATNGQGALILQDDGNLVLVRYSDRAPLWSSGTNGRRGANGKLLTRLVMQTDGNLCLYDDDGSLDSSWCTATQGHPGAFLQLQDDGNLVIVIGNRPVWNTATNVWTGTRVDHKTIFDIPGAIVQAASNAVADVVDAIRSIPVLGSIVNGAIDLVTSFANSDFGSAVLEVIDAGAAAAVIVLVPVSPMLMPALLTSVYAAPGIAKGEPLAQAYAKGLTEAFRVYARVGLSALGKAALANTITDNVEEWLGTVEFPPIIVEKASQLGQAILDAGKHAGLEPGILPADPQVALNGVANQLGLHVPGDVNEVAAHYAQEFGVPEIMARAQLDATLGLPPPAELIKGYDKNGKLIVNKAA
jgi:hypothetical protein